MAVASAEANNPEGQNLPATDTNAGLPVQVGDYLPVAEDEGNIIVARFRGLSRARQLQLIISIAAAIAMIVAIYLWSSEPNYKLLYGKISNQAASDIVQVLDQNGIKYQYNSSSGQIKVPASKLDDVRLKLAAKGLPKEDLPVYKPTLEELFSDRDEYSIYYSYLNSYRKLRFSKN